MSSDPMPPPLEPMPPESWSTLLPEVSAAPRSDRSPELAPTPLSPPLAPSGSAPPPLPTPPFSWRHDWPVVVLALCYVGGMILAALAGPQAPTSSAAWSPPSAVASTTARVAELLLLLALGGVLLLDWRGYFSLRGWVQRPRTASGRFLVGGLVILFCLISLPIYFVRRFLGKPQEAPPWLDLP